MTEKRCSKCGKVKPMGEFCRGKRFAGGLQPWCKLCTRAYRQANKERAAVVRKAYYATKGHAHAKRYYESRKDVILGKAKTHYRTHRNEIRERQRAYYEKETPRYRALGAKWSRNNPEKVSAISHRIRAHRKGAPGCHTASEWKALKSHYGHHCLCCKRKEPVIRLSPDHVIPLSRGGTNDIGNIQPLCHHCNLSKGAKTTDYRPPASQ